MSLILVSWEIGANYGHALGLLPAARELRRRGHKVVFALRDVRDAGAVLAAEGFAVLQAPFWPERRLRPNEQPASFAEIMGLFGFYNAKALSSMLAAWDSLYDFVQPDILVSSYAPVSLLAARLRGIPVALTGIGFEVPPDQSPVPSLRPWMKIPLARLQAAEQRVVDTLNQLGKPRGFEVKRYRELFNVERIFLNTFREFDHYESREPVQYDGALLVDDAGASPVWPDGKGRAIFAYLRPDIREFRPLLDAVRSLDVRLVLAAPGLSPQAAAALSDERISVVPGPVGLGAALRQAEVVISYASHGVCAAALLAGRPLLLLPQHLEQVLFARRIAALGAGLRPPDTQAESIVKTLGRLLEEPAHTQLAQAFAEHYADYRPQEQSLRMAAEIEQLAQTPLR